ncbi:ESPR domain-containing protein, partial [Achromobacter mucicolens]|uniref:ESPR domain-containing protein n=2 Tax=Achromobacter TaxID=222 RepID=UPI0028A1864C
MNRSYRLVWNQTLQMMQVAPEIATSRSSVPGSATHCRTPRRSLPRAAHQAGQIALMLGLTCAFPSAWAAGCAASDASACGASGGAGYPARSGN